MSAIATARVAWGADMPDWIMALAQECDRTSQNQTAKRIGRSASFVSTLVRNCYSAGLDGAEEVVRGALMSENISCPVLGEIGKHVCLKWRRRAGSFENVNTQHVMMYRACNRCPRCIGGDHV